MKQILSLVLSLVFFTGCGRDEVNFNLDSLGSDSVPLDEYEGKGADDLKQAYKLAMEMGFVFPPVLVRTSNLMISEDRHEAALGYCVPETKAIVMQPIDLSGNEQGLSVVSWVEVLAHEYGHCILQLDHSESGVMHYGLEEESVSHSSINIEKFSERYALGISLRPLIEYTIKNENPVEFTQARLDENHILQEFIDQSSIVAFNINSVADVKSYKKKPLDVLRGTSLFSIFEEKIGDKNLWDEEMEINKTLCADWMNEDMVESLHKRGLQAGLICNGELAGKSKIIGYKVRGRFMTVTIKRYFLFKNNAVEK